VEGTRLRCRAHNQYEAERVFGAGFMSEKREVARLARAEAQTRVAASESVHAKAAAEKTSGHATEVETLTRATEAEERAQASVVESERPDATELEKRLRAIAEEAEARSRAAAAEARSQAIAHEHAEDVMACLHELGYRVGEARRAVASCMTLPDATLEERIRAALKFLAPKACFSGRVGTRLEARS
jgi:hypothetical protein